MRRCLFPQWRVTLSKPVLSVIEGSKGGASLIELLVFLAILAVVVASALPMLFASAENRMLQQTVAIVEQNGTQALQDIALTVRRAERILHPPAGETGSFLALQMSSGALHPTIVGVYSGSVIIVEHTTRERITSPQVAIQEFVVRNTSTADDRPSVALSFSVSRTIKLQLPRSYMQRFETALTLLPHDRAVGNPCNCSPPTCLFTNILGWQVCQSSSCVSATTPLQCP